jgi:hypothetical protein
MTWLTDFWRSSIGGKVTMAVTGVRRPIEVQLGRSGRLAHRGPIKFD